MKPWLAAVPALLPPAALAWLVFPRVVNVPIYDEWLWAPLVLKAATGTLAAGDLWAQQNAHRSPVPTAVALLLAGPSRWDVRWEIAASFVVTALTVILATMLLAPRHRPGGLVLFSAMLFGTAQIENWTWGFQMSWFLVDLGIVATIASLCRPAAVGIAGAIVAALCATLSLSTGFGAWLAGAIMLRRTRSRLWMWGAAAAATIVVFAVGYTVPAAERSNLDASGWGSVLLAIPALLGAPLARIFGVEATIAAGIAAVLCAVLLARGAVTPEPWIALLAATTFGAVSIAVARAGGGPEEMLTSRYATLGTLWWTGLAGLCLTHAWRGRRRIVVRVAAIATGLLWLASSLPGLFSADGIADLQRDELQRVRRVATGGSADLSDFTPNVPLTRAAIDGLRARRLGPFAQRNSTGT